MRFLQISEKVAASPSLDFGSIFNNTIELFKKVWLQGFITVLLMMVVILPFYIILYVPMIASGMMDPYAYERNDLPSGMLVFLIVFYPIMIIGISTFAMCLNAAFLRICKRIDLDQMGKDDYFYYFKKPYLKKAFVLALIITGLSILGMLACGIGLIYLVVPMSLFPAFFAFDEELTPSEITKASFALGNKNWLIIFGLIFVTGLIAQLGVLLCFVGVFFTAMLGRIPTYFIYKEIVGFSSEE
ncbi:hypothetical protein [Flagellimonas allohymeniacidonis]|uniref:Glycerophosphoryl diester phosphodiesterase membrane domain-containing protein n=1 Tax=Flagellimonas allohymeniacidonis TaxID=2517819 RepID=A0A4Q8QFT2_9FLAO|nr:hypothetical protein [Allomuricauda hymeniacidonis]TAI48068.1 hypothetical protein EW142_15590 [Allomuricauda hymeniacidonis]